jgi:hypothetical protein
VAGLSARVARRTFGKGRGSNSECFGPSSASRRPDLLLRPTKVLWERLTLASSNHRGDRPTQPCRQAKRVPLEAARDQGCASRPRGGARVDKEKGTGRFAIINCGKPLIGPARCISWSLTFSRATAGRTESGKGGFESLAWRTC